ncbi:MAG: putative molybdenum cofactor guanylyltransferase [Ignavibacteria bacterium]|nr:putative molybdenum cofactor guanylyltransferase [Ignavibacteria bacterium]
MDYKNEKMNGYILAGGKSTRMGMDKGLMMLKGKAIIQHIIEQTTPLMGNVIIVSNDIEYEKFGLKVIGDIIKDIGPAGGIHAAMSDMQINRSFIVSCDMPFVTPDSIEFMLRQAEDFQITLPVHNGKVQTLFGIYSKDCLDNWAKLIEQGIVKLQEMILHFKLKKINVDNNELFNDLLFTNINDKNDYNAILKQSNYGN